MKTLAIIGLAVAGIAAVAFFSTDRSVSTGNAIVELQPPVAAKVETPLEGYFIAVSAVPKSKFIVEISVETNIPLPVEVMAGVSIKDQKPTDTFIGKSSRVYLTKPSQTIRINGQSENLPAGDYDVEVTFYSRWGAENGSKDAAKIDRDIEGVTSVTLGGSGETKATTDSRNIAQKWVMENVVIGTAWDESQFAKQLGEFQKSQASLNLHDAYYFPDADMTLIVSQVKNSVTIWRMGKTDK